MLDSAEISGICFHFETPLTSDHHHHHHHYSIFTTVSQFELQIDLKWPFGVYRGSKDYPTRWSNILVRLGHYIFCLPTWVRTWNTRALAINKSFSVTTPEQLGAKLYVVNQPFISLQSFWNQPSNNYLSAYQDEVSVDSAFILHIIFRRQLLLIYRLLQWTGESDWLGQLHLPIWCILRRGVFRTAKARHGDDRRHNCFCGDKMPVPSLLVPELKCNNAWSVYVGSLLKSPSNSAFVTTPHASTFATSGSMSIPNPKSVTDTLKAWRLLPRVFGLLVLLLA